MAETIRGGFSPERGSGVFFQKIRDGLGAESFVSIFPEEIFARKEGEPPSG
jgi:hypothetical protein